MRLDPLSGQVLHHDCISVIFSRFTFFTQNFVICCYQVTNIFSKRYGSAIASPARGPCDFGPYADIAISVFREVSKILCLPDTTFARGTEGNLWEELEASTPVANLAHLSTGHCVLPRCRHFCLGFRFLLVHATGFPVLAHSYSHFFLLLEFPCQSQFPSMKM